MEPLVPGCNRNAAALHAQIPVGMQRIIRRIERQCAAGDIEKGTRLKALDTHAVRGIALRLPVTPEAARSEIAGFLHGIGCAAAGGHGAVTARDNQLGLGLDAVLGRIDCHTSALQIDKSLRLIRVVVRTDAVAAGRHSDRAARNGDIVLALNAVSGSLHGQCAARDDKVILRGDALVALSVNGQTAAAVDSQAVLAVNGSIGRTVLRIGIGAAVGDCILRPVGKREEDLLGTFHIERTAVGGGDGRIIENELDLPLACDRDPAVREGAGQPVDALVRDGDLTARKGHTAAVHLGRIPGQGNDRIGIGLAGEVPVGEKSFRVKAQKRIAVRFADGRSSHDLLLAVSFGMSFRLVGSAVLYGLCSAAVSTVGIAAAVALLHTAAYQKGKCHGSAEQTGKIIMILHVDHRFL